MTHDVISQLEPQRTTARIDSIPGIYHIDDIQRSTDSNSSSRVSFLPIFSPMIKVKRDATPSTPN